MLGRNEANAVGFTASASWGWLVAAQGVGLLGDRFGIPQMMWISFGGLAGCWVVLDSLGGGSEILVIVDSNLVVVNFDA